MTLSGLAYLEELTPPHNLPELWRELLEAPVRERDGSVLLLNVTFGTKTLYQR